MAQFLQPLYSKSCVPGNHLLAEKGPKSEPKNFKKKKTHNIEEGQKKHLRIGYYDKRFCLQFQKGEVFSCIH